MGNKHVSTMLSTIKNASDMNEQHDIEVDSERVAAEQNVAKNTQDILQHCDSKNTIQHLELY